MPPLPLTAARNREKKCVCVPFRTSRGTLRCWQPPVLWEWAAASPLRSEVSPRQGPAAPRVSRAGLVRLSLSCLFFTARLCSVTQTLLHLAGKNSRGESVSSMLFCLKCEENKNSPQHRGGNRSDDRPTHVFIHLYLAYRQ